MSNEESPRNLFDFKTIAVEKASLSYFFSDGESCCEVMEMNSFQVGQGKKLIKKLVDTIGPNKSVVFPAIIEPETRKTLKNQGILAYVQSTGKTVEITRENMFRSLKIANVIMSGGMFIEKIVISKWDDNLLMDEEMALELDGFRVIISIYART